jgi:hypothetical protein
MTDLGGLHRGSQATDFSECILVLDGVGPMAPFQMGVLSRLIKYTFCHVYAVSSGSVLCAGIQGGHTPEERELLVSIAKRILRSFSVRTLLNLSRFRDQSFAKFAESIVEMPFLTHFDHSNVTIVFVRADGSRRSELIRSLQDWERFSRCSTSIRPLGVCNSEGASDPVALCAEDLDPRHLGRRIVRVRSPHSFSFWLGLFYRALRGNGPQYLFESGERAADNFLLRGGGAEGAPGISVLQNALYLPSRRWLTIRVFVWLSTLRPLAVLGALAALASPLFLQLWRRVLLRALQKHGKVLRRA